MAKIQFNGMDAYVRQLESLSNNVEPDIGKAVYEGAKVVADAVRAATEALPVERSRHATPENPLRGVTSTQKQGLLGGLGISHMSKDGDYLNVKIGFDGYNAVRSVKYPKGQPNAMIARSVNNGTSIRKRTGFVDKAVNRSKGAAEQAMAAALDKAIQERTK